MRGKKVPENIVSYDTRQRIRKPRVIRYLRGVIHWGAVPGMLTTYELINYDYGLAVAFRSIPCCHIGHRSSQAGAEGARRCRRAVIRLWSGPVTKNIILRRERRMEALRETAHGEGGIKASM